MRNHRTNVEWLFDLKAGNGRQAEALKDLRLILLRAAQVTFDRYLGNVSTVPDGKIAHLAEDCAQEALIAILAHLPEFRGESKFTTWAYKFAVNIALSTARRERWKSLPLTPVPEDYKFQYQPGVEIEGKRLDPEIPALQREIWALIQTVIQNDLTDRQRAVIKYMVFDEIPMDVVVERLNTNRNAVYKLLHDARLKIKTRLLEHGFTPNDILSVFNQEK
jgi:RNA polymerase sigma-70 factor (ECF subfamily)